MEEAIGSSLLQKLEVKSEPFLVNRRSGCGWSAWAAINKWYMAMSGEGLSNRMHKLVQLTQAKNDEYVAFEVERWMDELKECRARGASETG